MYEPHSGRAATAPHRCRPTYENIITHWLCTTKSGRSRLSTGVSLVRTCWWRPRRVGNASRNRTRARVVPGKPVLPIRATVFVKPFRSNPPQTVYGERFFVFRRCLRTANISRFFPPSRFAQKRPNDYCGYAKTRRWKFNFVKKTFEPIFCRLKYYFSRVSTYYTDVPGRLSIFTSAQGSAGSRALVLYYEKYYSKSRHLTWLVSIFLCRYWFCFTNILRRRD